jgi:hypothetical protein
VTTLCVLLFPPFTLPAAALLRVFALDATVCGNDVRLPATTRWCPVVVRTMPEHSADSALHIGAFRSQQTITLPIHNGGCAGSLCQKNKPKRTLIAFVIPLVPKLARLGAGLSTSYQTPNKVGTRKVDFCFPHSPSLFIPEGHILGIGSVAGVEVLAAIACILAAVFFLCTSCLNKGFPLPFSLQLVPVMAPSIPKFADLCRVGYEYRCKLPLTLTMRVSVFERAATSLF